MVGIKRRLLDFCLAPTLTMAARPMRFVRRYALPEMPRAYGALSKAGVFPILDHYYEPLFNTRDLRNLDEPRSLPSIDLNLNAQVELLKSFDDIAGLDSGTDGFGPNPNFWSGDAELWFYVIRHFKPRRIYEIGSGYSTRMAVRAVNHNRKLDSDYVCDHVCIEPYEMPWLEATGVQVVRQRVEDLNLLMFEELKENDILFIDSSHIIRPQGDVLREYLQIIPRLAKGAIVHVHDIFTPRDYTTSFYNVPRFWNEQYLLEAFLAYNKSWEVLLAANMLKHECFDLLKSKCIWLTADREPGSFYMRRV